MGRLHRRVHITLTKEENRTTLSTPKRANEVHLTRSGGQLQYNHRADNNLHVNQLVSVVAFLGKSMFGLTQIIGLHRCN